MDTLTRFARFVVAILIGAFALSACSSVSALTAMRTPAPLGLTQTVAPGATVGEPPSPTITASETPAATATATVTATKPAVSSRPRATPTPLIPPSVYVTAVKIDPMPARSNESPQFTVTFLNTTGQIKPYRWFVKVYKPDQPKSFGETAKTDNDIPPKTAQLQSGSGWKTMAVLDCLSLIARVFWVDQNNQVIEFSKPGGGSPAKGFSVCP